jgi:hypothetical protein
MYKTIDVYEFANTFERSDSYKNNFTRPALMALYDYLEDLYEDMGELYEFDMIALCCEYSEYKSAWEAMEQYQPEDMPVEGEEGDDLIEIQEKNEAAALEWLQDRTAVIEFDGGIIIQQF